MRTGSKFRKHKLVPNRYHGRKKPGSFPSARKLPVVSIPRHVPIHQKKYFDFAYLRVEGQAPVDVIPGLSSVQEGVTNFERVGRSIKVVRVMMTTVFQSEEGGTLLSRCRYALVIEKNPQSATPPLDDLLQDLPFSLTVDQFRRLDNVRKYDIVYDRRVAMNSFGYHSLNTRGTGVMFTDKFTYKKPFTIQFADSGGSESQNRLLFLNVYDFKVPGVVCNVRLEYFDAWYVIFSRLSSVPSDEAI